jgi:hypothetical protein
LAQTGIRLWFYLYKLNIVASNQVLSLDAISKGRLCPAFTILV